MVAIDAIHGGVMNMRERHGQNRLRAFEIVIAHGLFSGEW
jgi:hypothetical protein